MGEIGISRPRGGREPKSRGRSKEAVIQRPSLGLKPSSPSPSGSTNLDRARQRLKQEQRLGEIDRFWRISCLHKRKTRFKYYFLLTEPLPVVDQHSVIEVNSRSSVFSEKNVTLLEKLILLGKSNPTIKSFIYNCIE